MTIKSFFVLVIFIFSISYVSAQVSIGSSNNITNGVNIINPFLTSGSVQNATLNVNNSNCWGGNCNTSSYVRKTGDTMSGTLIWGGVSQVIDLLGVYDVLSYSQPGGWTTPTFNAFLLVDPALGLTTWNSDGGFSFDDLITAVGGVSITIGDLYMNSRNIVHTTGGNGTGFDYVYSNNTETRNATMNTISNKTGAITNLAFPFNGTGSYNKNQLLIPHPAYITTALSFDTIYNNTNDRPIRIDFSFYSDVKANPDMAYVEMKRGYTTPNQVISRAGVLFNDFTAADASTLVLHHISGTIQPGERYSFTTNVSGSGNIQSGGDPPVVQITIL